MTEWIIVRPKWEEVTEYSYAWCQQILDWLKEEGVEFVDLGAEDATRDKVEAMLRKYPQANFCFYDHGNADLLAAQGGKDNVIDLNNCDLLANKETYTMACLSAKSLGKEVWNKGGKYWGYIDTFSFTSDTVADFQEAANCGFHYLFIEGDRENALQRAKDTFSRLALELVDAGKILAAACMRNDGDILVYYNAEKPEEGKGCLLAFLRLLLFRRAS